MRVGQARGSAVELYVSAMWRAIPDLAPPFVSIVGSPVVDEALVQIATEVSDSYLAGDHTLFLGEVESLELREGAPLIFHGGAYRALADQHEWTETRRDPGEQWPISRRSMTPRLCGRVGVAPVGASSPRHRGGS